MDTIVTAPAAFDSFTDYYQNNLAHFPQKHRSGGSFEISMIQVEQPAIELIDPPINQLSVVGILSNGSHAEFDIGDGWTEKKPFRKGCVGIQPANQICGFRIHQQTIFLVASAPVGKVIELLDRAGIYSDPFLHLYDNLPFSPSALNLLQSMWTAMDRGGPANNLLVDGCYIAILGQVLRNNADIRAFSIVPDLAKPQLMRVIDYIETHFDAPLLTSELAAIAAMSVAQFGRSFKAATGYSPHAYVTLRRIEHAKRMLRQADLTITQIAFCCGFSSAAHFATTFQQYLGQTPTAYRVAAF